MWVYIVALALFVIGVFGSLLGGGIFTIVLIPLGLIALGAAVVSGMSGRAAQGTGGAATDQTHTSDRPLPTSHQRPSGRAPSSPEQLADTRRAQQ
jgi:multisubunit Na+/H+ antiporter MnhC subunit